jgi:hypothetical protein
MWIINRIEEFSEYEISNTSLSFRKKMGSLNVTKLVNDIINSKTAEGPTSCLLAFSTIANGHVFAIYCIKLADNTKKAFLLNISEKKAFYPKSETTIK